MASSSFTRPEEKDDKKEDHFSNHLFSLPGFKEIPDKFIVNSPESQQLFKDALYKQGFVIICYKNILYLVPSFNYGDNKLKENKEGKPYELWHSLSRAKSEEEAKLITAKNDELIHKGSIFCTSTREDAPIGIVHYEGMEILQATNKIPSEIHFDHPCLLGAGIFKGDEHALLSDFRVSSATFNLNAIKYDPEYLAIFHYFDGAILQDGRDKAWWISRRCPAEISKKIFQAVTEQLLPGVDIDRKTVQRCTMNLTTFKSEEEVWWDKFFNNPEEKNKKLIKTFYYGIKRNASSMKVEERASTAFLQDVIKYINKNIEQLPEKTREERRIQLFNYKDRESDESLLKMAIRNDNLEVVQSLLTLLSYSKEDSSKVFDAYKKIMQWGLDEKYDSEVLKNPEKAIKIVHDIETMLSPLEDKSLQSNSEIIQFLVERPNRLPLLNDMIKKSKTDEHKFDPDEVIDEIRTQEKQIFLNIKHAIHEAIENDKVDDLVPLLNSSDISIRDQENNFIFLDPYMTLKIIRPFLRHINEAKWESWDLNNINNLLATLLTQSPDRYDHPEIYREVLHTIKNNLLKLGKKYHSDLQDFLDNNHYPLLQEALFSNRPKIFADILIEEGVSLDNPEMLLSVFNHCLFENKIDIIDYLIAKIKEQMPNKAPAVFKLFAESIVENSDDVDLLKKIIQQGPLSEEDKHKEKEIKTSASFNYEDLAKIALFNRHFDVAKYLLTQLLKEDEINKLIDSCEKLATWGILSNYQALIGSLNEINEMAHDIQTRVIAQIEEKTLHSDNTLLSYIIKHEDKIPFLNKVVAALKTNKIELNTAEILDFMENPDEILFNAVKENDITKVTRLLAMGADFSKKNIYGDFAFTQNRDLSIEMLSLFIKEIHSKKDWSDDDLRRIKTTLEHALVAAPDRHKNPDVYQAILDTLKTNAITPSGNISESMKNYLNLLLQKEIKVNQPPFVDMIVKTCVSVNDPYLLREISYNCVVQNSKELFDFFINELKKQFPEQIPRIFLSFIDLIVFFSREESGAYFLDVLIRSGINFNHRFEYQFDSKENISTFLLAANCGRLDFMKLLLNEAQEHKESFSSSSAAFFHPEKPINQKSNLGNTALIMAAHKNHHLILDFLIGEGADINIQNQKGYTALMEAALNLDAEAVKRLLNAGATIDETQLLHLQSDFFEKNKHNFRLDTSLQTKFDEIVFQINNRPKKEI